MEDKRQGGGATGYLHDENGDPELVRRSASTYQGMDSQEDDLCQLIDQLRVECKKGKNQSVPAEPCVNCKMKTKENSKFVNLYKQLIEDIVKSIAS